MIRNKAARFNLNMMFAMALMGVVILGCAYSFMYLAVSSQASDEEVEVSDSLEVNSEQYTINNE